MSNGLINLGHFFIYMSDFTDFLYVILYVRLYRAYFSL